MQDPWRFVAFPVAAIVGYLLSLGVTSQVSTVTGFGQITSAVLVVAVAGFFAGFMVDEVIPAYLEKIAKNRGGGFGGGGGSSFGGGGGGFDDDDLDFE